jgi:hypothetical protein
VLFPTGKQKSHYYQRDNHNATQASIVIHLYFLDLQLSLDYAFAIAETQYTPIGKLGLLPDDECVVSDRGIH